jgi:hypothetical protein
LLAALAKTGATASFFFESYFVNATGCSFFLIALVLPGALSLG